jgi:hypothetical protein
MIRPGSEFTPLHSPITASALLLLLNRSKHTKASKNGTESKAAATKRGKKAVEGQS